MFPLRPFALLRNFAAQKKKAAQYERLSLSI
jgi:hypothetical protein